MNDRHAGRHRVERLIEQAVFGPLDLTIRIVAGLPDTIERARRQLVAARFVGKMAVDQGLAEVRRRAADDVREAPAPPQPRDRAGEPAVAEPVDASITAPAAADLALPDYEQLPASHVVAKLAGLRQAERDEIEAFETAHRHRRTILGKLQQLRES